MRFNFVWIAVLPCLLVGCHRHERLTRPYRIAVTPLDDLNAIRDRVRALPASNRVHGVEVVLAPGEYPLSGTLNLTKEDGGSSASAPVVWKAREPRQSRIVFAVKVPVEAFGPVKDAAVRSRLPESERDKILCADISGIVPGTIPPLADVFGGAPGAPILYVDHELQTLARWPNRGFTSFTVGYDTGARTLADGRTQYEPGAFIYANERTKRWDFAKGVWMNGYWTHDWANFSVRIASYGTENGTNNVVRHARGVPYGVKCRTWGRNDRRFYVFNVLEELDAPGEWFLDRERKILYLYAETGRMDATSEVRLCLKGVPMLVGKGVSHLRIEGLDFEYGYNYGLVFKNCESVSVVNCRIGNLASGGVVMEGYRNVLSNCEIYGIGATAVEISGGDRAKLVNSDSRIEDCDIHDFGVFKKTYAPGIRATGIGMTIRGNEIHSAPHAAVLYEGNEMRFESNDVHHVLLETGDAGAFYTGRDWTTQGNVLRGNFIHELGKEGGDSSTMGIYFDDGDCGDAVYGNVFWRMARGIMIGGGRDHPVMGNVFVECDIGLSIDCRGITWPIWNQPGGSWHLEGKAEALHYKEDPWRAKYPRLANIMNDSPREPLYNPVVSNTFVNCTKQLLLLDKAKAMDVVIPKLEISDNLVYVYPVGSKTALPDSRIAGGFEIRTNEVWRNLSGRDISGASP